MGQQIEWDKIPDAKTPPEAGMYLFVVDDIVEVTTNPERGIPRKMYKASYSIVEPTGYAGTALDDYFTVGTNDDPQALQSATWMASIGVKRLKELFKATQISLSPDVSENIEACKGQRFIGSLIQSIDDGRRKQPDGTYAIEQAFAGRRQVKMNRMYTVGSRPISGGAPSGTEAIPLPTPVAPPPARPARPQPAPTVQCPYCPTPTVLLRSEYGAHAKLMHPEEG